MTIKRVLVKEVEELQTLRQLAQPVSTLFYAGNLSELLARPLVAIVGSRKVTSYGQSVTYKLAHELAKAGIVIISGLALGVDSIAHRAALDAGGTTIAVLPTGMDRIYPASHYGLARQIVTAGGALVSEYPVGKGPPQKFQFIARNRIIAALSRGVIITEATAKSGSLHTANFALEQGIDVFAVPGNITSPNSEGTNNLIKSGAQPVTRAQDVLEVLGIEPQAKPVTANDERDQAIISVLQAGITEVDQLLERSRLDPALFQQTLSMLEIKGIIRPTGGSTWTLI